MTEYVDHLHEHFVHPVVISNGCYRVPEVTFLILTFCTPHVEVVYIITVGPITIAVNFIRVSLEFPEVFRPFFFLLTPPIEISFFSSNFAIPPMEYCRI